MKTKILDTFSRGKNIIIRNRRTIMIASLLAGVVFLVIPHLALAAPGDPPPSSPDLDKMYRDITKFLTFILEFLQRLIWPVLLLIGGLMKNDILFGAGMEDRMLAIWVQIRNLVNILFVLVLLGIAFYNVVGGTNQAYQLKGILPKFVIGLIAVNFSFIGVKLVVDTVNVTTTAIFALPNAVQDGLGKNPVGDKDFVQTICKGMYGEDASQYEQHIADANKEKAGSALCKSDYTFVDKAQQFFANFDAHNAGIIMAVNLSKINDWGKVKDGVKDFKGLALNTIFSATLFIVFATAFVALFVVLLIRLIVLWVTLVLSPLIVLTYVLPENLMGSVGGGDLKKKFIANAIAPLPIALMMTIGFMMLQGMKDSKFTSISNLGMDTSSISMGLFSSGLSTLQELVIAVGTIAVIWMGVFEAAKGTYASPIVDKIAGAVKGVGSFAASSLKYAPIFPVSGVKGEDGKPMKMSLAGAMGMADRMQEGRQDQVRKETSAAMKGFEAGKARPYSDAIYNATNKQQLLQAIANAKAGGVSDLVQKDIAIAAKRLRLDKGSELKIPATMIIDGKEVKANINDLMAAMAKGTVGAATMQEFARLNTEGIQGQQIQEEKKKEGEKGATKKEDHDKAKVTLDQAGSSEKALSTDQQGKIKAYRDALNGKDDKKKNETLQDLQASGAITALDQMANGRADFRAAASRANTGVELDKEIEKRRGEIVAAKKAAGVANPDPEEVNQILRSELDEVIKGNSKAVQESTTAPNGEVKKIKDKTVIGKAAPTADYVEPAAGKKAGSGAGAKAGGGTGAGTGGAAKPAAKTTIPANATKGTQISIGANEPVPTGWTNTTNEPDSRKNITKD